MTSLNDDLLCCNLNTSCNKLSKTAQDHPNAKFYSANLSIFENYEHKKLLNHPNVTESIHPAHHRWRQALMIHGDKASVMFSNYITLGASINSPLQALMSRDRR